MRWLLIAVSSVLFSAGVNASDLLGDNSLLTELASPVAASEESGDSQAFPSLVAIASPVATPLVEVSGSFDATDGARQRLGRKKHSRKSILSRTARSQMALLAEKPQPQAGNAVVIDFFDGQESDSGADDLDFHRSFSHPRVVDQDDDEEFAISEHARLRLLMARMKAVNVHQVAQANNQSKDEGGDFSETVKLRLFMARMKAIRVHQEMFS